MSEDTVTIEVNGQSYEAHKGQMLIEVTDANNVYIPRFCYHKKLSVAANCRMCLVEVEKAPKPLPACATPVADGMKVFTRSQLALDAQKSVMEFLLINHPLDCPICDQGGECELQDLAMGYGRDVSRYNEGKRVVKDKDIGPLVRTEMTRCIHCTRCVRFGEEIAGLRELGATGRGEDMEIGTYVEKTMASELSGNVIDLCPVGALTNKPFRYSARTWEMVQRPSIASHDSVGSNLYFHVKGQIVKRIVPAENEAVNEVWLADRDRYSHFGLNSSERLQVPMIKQHGEWHEVDWEVALEQAHDRLQSVLDRDGPDALAGLIAPWATFEEQHLFQKLLRGLGTQHIDHRLHQHDFRDDDDAPMFPGLGQPITNLEQLDAALLIGAYPRKEQPLINHRLRKAALGDARVMAINPIDYDLNFELAERCIVAPSQMVTTLAGVAAALLEQQPAANNALQQLVSGVSVSDAQRRMADELRQATNKTILLGVQASAHPEFSVLRALAGELAELTGAIFGYLPEAANSTGAWLAGAVPHRTVLGEPVSASGLNARTMFEQPRRAYCLFGLEPERDCWNGHDVIQSLEQADCVIAFSAYLTETLQNHADVILPLGLYAETAGSYINAEGRLQSFNGAVAAPGMARPGWKILRVLGNLFDLDDFDYNNAEEVRVELEDGLTRLTTNHDNKGWQLPSVLPRSAAQPIERVTFVPTNSLDPLVRHAEPLQQTFDVADGYAHVHPDTAARLGLAAGGRVRIRNGSGDAELPVAIDASLAMDCVLIHATHPDAFELGGWFGQLELQRSGA